MIEKDDNKINFLNIGVYIIITIVSAFISALGLWVFVYPSDFVPSGVDGIATMLQALTDVNAGIYSFILNLPLLVLAWIFLKHKYVIYTVLFTILNSIFLILFEYVGFYQYASNQILSSIFSGIILGVRTGLMLKIGSSSGGVDIIACIIQVKSNYKYVEKLVSAICYIIIIFSIFVYRDIECVLMSIIQMFVFEKTITAILSDNRNAVEVKIITKEPNEIKSILLYELKHGATLLQSKGGFTDDDNTVIYSVINKRQMTEFLKIIKRFPNTFIYCSEVNGVYGNFRWMKNDEVK